MAATALITGAPTCASENLDQISAPTRRGVLAVIAGLGVVSAVVPSPTTASAPIEPLRNASLKLVREGRSPVALAADALRAHDQSLSDATRTLGRDLDDHEEAAWLLESDRLQQAFAFSRALDARDLAKKMHVALFEDLLTEANSHNTMVAVMSQLERWA